MQEEQSGIMKSVFTGVFGGFIFGLLNSFTYVLSFTDVSHASFMIRSLFQGNWTTTWWIEIISAMILGILTILPAIIYYLSFKTFGGVSPGLLYGVVLWVIVFWLINPWFDYVPTIDKLSLETIVTTLCQFVLYGVFVGYTISYDYHGERVARKV